MKKQVPMKNRVKEYEYMDEETLEMVKTSCVEEQEITFYLKPFGVWFTPSGKDQERLNYIIENADPIELLYSTDSIKLCREYVDLDSTYKEEGRRPPTEEDFKNHFSSSYWEEAWKDYQATLKTSEKEIEK